MTALARLDAVASFNQNSDIRVMLLSLRAGGLGLNLTVANHVVLTDMHWNPMLEAQAVDRIYRVGQSKPSFVHTFVAKNTMDEKLVDLQVRFLCVCVCGCGCATHCIRWCDDDQTSVPLSAMHFIFVAIKRMHGTLANL